MKRKFEKKMFFDIFSRKIVKFVSITTYSFFLIFSFSIIFQNFPYNTPKFHTIYWKVRERKRAQTVWQQSLRCVNSHQFFWFSIIFPLQNQWKLVRICKFSISLFFILAISLFFQRFHWKFLAFLCFPTRLMQSAKK